MSTNVPSDAAVRREALDPTRSFVVQAPAGSGKTGLLIQRYLALLARVARPEEVLAITFTRKAAGEMRERITSALVEAGSASGAVGADADPADHAARTRQLARAVLERDRRLGWRLTEQPSRLRISTIDAQCAYLARRMPWLSGLGGGTRTVDDAHELYREAVREVLAGLDEGGEWAAATERVLGHLDNDLRRFERMMVEMLGRRDQWLRFLAPGVGAGDRRAELEAALARAVGGELERLQRAVPAALAPELVAVCRYAAASLADSGARSDLDAWGSRNVMPGADPDDLPAWRALAGVLLTAKGEPRARLTRAEGFPSGKAARDPGMRDRALAAAAALGEHEVLHAGLARVRELPEPRYSDSQWEVLHALLEVLRTAAGWLRVIFAEHGVMDFIEVVAAARHALGDPDDPTDLALALDERIAHLLVDEFQDTSHTHHELLELLTAGWQPDDGRTAFLVGDPMQSIYRFREADVGLFLRSERHGLGTVPLEPLRLEANFRSGSAIVDWINDAFPHVLAREDDPATGAVRFRPSVAMHAAGAEPAVSTHVLAEDADPATRVVEVLARARAGSPEATLAVLVRTRAHLAGIVPALAAAGIAFHGTDIDPLGRVPVVRDLLALTRALLHAGDRAAWLSLLRAPWCGLDLRDLLIVAGDHPRRTLPASLRDPAMLDALDADSRERVRRLLAVTDAARESRGSRRLRRMVEGTWLGLGGPACVDADELHAAQAYLDRLDVLAQSGPDPDPARIEAEMASLFARTEPAPGAVEIMTIHRAKGLEFDVVVLPELDRTTRGDEHRLLGWTRSASGPGGADLLLAPLPAGDGDESAAYHYLRRLDAEKLRHEQARLLYVATTRARRELHLVARVRSGEDGAIRAPAPGSLLASLWPAVSGKMLAAGVEEDAATGAAPVGPAAPTIHRLPLTWNPPEPAPDAGTAGEVAPLESLEPIEFDWAGRTARHVGTLVHRMLRVMAEEGVTAWPAARLDAHRARWRTELEGLGVEPGALDAALDQVRLALERVAGDARARWMLDPEAPAAGSEVALSGLVDDRVVHVAVDRTFVDPDGTRWIVDFKTGAHTGGDLDGFLDRERERYQAQLERYAALFQALDGRPVRLGLYFPLVSGWREWAWSPRAAG